MSGDLKTNLRITLRYGSETDPLRPYGITHLVLSMIDKGVKNYVYLELAYCKLVDSVWGRYEPMVAEGKLLSFYRDLEKNKRTWSYKGNGKECIYAHSMDS